ncbi:MAG: hypothetical protein RMY16_31885 [Nostoc sp. DedQUE12b]|uniref:hypothetical protein n=1 Tax=Nostoc sp. DedQUE12b TaxID=3075398 RepID=UPI002AD28CA9|nr:hypothetical protein [Nostoc sp. DedQUE12b]MDZ8090121.1 hypothetical protein [Nostoc sp. DedQUE12b]
MTKDKGQKTKRKQFNHEIYVPTLNHYGCGAIAPSRHLCQRYQRCSTRAHYCRSTGVNATDKRTDPPTNQLQGNTNNDRR